MINFFIILLFFLLHIKFYLQNILFGYNDAALYSFHQYYSFDVSVSEVGLYFVSLCALAWYLGHLFGYKKAKTLKKLDLMLPGEGIHRNLSFEYNIICFILFFYVAFIVYICIKFKFNYNDLVVYRENNSFIFEARMLVNILISYVFFNISPRRILLSKRFLVFRSLYLLYIVSLFLFQARSLIMEVGLCSLYPILMWARDRFKFRYAIFLSFLFLIPNFLVMVRLGFPSDFYVFLKDLFTFEYEMLLDNFLSASIVFSNSPNSHGDFSFLQQLVLIVPSFLRDFFSLHVSENSMIVSVSEIANIKSGGFSLLAQLYHDFYWYSLLVLFLMGLGLGYLSQKALNVGRVSMFASSAPLYYSAFILSLRNDLGVLVKYSIQLLIVALIFQIIFYLLRKNSHKLIS